MHSRWKAGERIGGKGLTLKLLRSATEMAQGEREGERALLACYLFHCLLNWHMGRELCNSVNSAFERW
jgi:hypothetical protein